MKTSHPILEIPGFEKCFHAEIPGTWSSCVTAILCFSFCFLTILLGAYKDRKAPKYRKATKIPESTYKYQKAMENQYL